LSRERVGGLQHVIPGRSSVEFRGLSRLFVKSGHLLITQLKPGNAAAFIQQSGLAASPFAVFAFALRQRRVPHLRRVGKLKLLGLRVRFGEHPFDGAREVLSPGRGFLQILEDPLHQAWQLICGISLIPGMLGRSRLRMSVTACIEAIPPAAALITSRSQPLLSLHFLRVPLLGAPRFPLLAFP
jgi:hypothetical protein